MTTPCCPAPPSWPLPLDDHAPRPPTPLPLDEIPGALVTGVQLSDVPSEPPTDLAYATRYQRLAPGEGALDLVGLLQTLRRIGCRAPLAVEVFDAERVAQLGCSGFARFLADLVRGLQHRAAS